MIHEIVSSDVEFARGMMDSGHPDTELLAYLATRGLDPAKAAQLVDDLRHGRESSAQLPYELRPASPSAIGSRETPRGAAQPAPHPHRKRSGSRKHTLSAIPWWFVILVGCALLALGYVLVQTGDGLATEGVNKDKHELPPAPTIQP
jgi:hypothetical protein